jgi:hypothetical protein
MRVTRAEFDAAMEAATNEADRIQFIGALVGRATDSEAIIVGGSAVYLLAPSLEPSLDVDIVTRTSPAAAAIEAWGFVRRKGRVWRREDLQIDVDLLPHFTGSRNRTLLIETRYGPVRVACPEDMIIKRLAELKHWPTGGEWRAQLVDQVTVLLAEYTGRIDEAYLEDRARREDVADILLDFQTNR